MSANNIFSYTRRDYETSRKEGIANIPRLSNGVWTDLNATDPGIIILDYVHALVDMINYYQDHQALESFIVTARERANLFRLAKQFSYDIRSAKGAKVVVKFHSDFLYDRTIKIPKYTKVSTASHIEYFTIEDAYLKAGETDVSVVCEQGRLYEKTYTGTGLSRFSAVEPPDNVNQSLTLTPNNIDIDSISVTDSLGRVWSPVDYIVFSTEYDRVYQAELNPDNSITIKFGDGQRGVVPKTTDVFTIRYITSNAEEGKIGAGAIVQLDTAILSDIGEYIELSVTNEEASVGGSSAQSSSSIRELAPGAIKAQNRAVTLSDFENLAKLVPGVGDARAYDINTDPDLCLYHEVKVLIIPQDKTASKSILTSDVYNYLYQRMIPPTNLQVLTPSANIINIDLVVKKLDTSIDTGRLEYELTKTINNYFDTKAKEIGENFYPADLSAVLQSVEGVRYVISMSPSSVQEISKLSIAELGTLNITIQ